MSVTHQKKRLKTTKRRRARTEEMLISSAVPRYQHTKRRWYERIADEEESRVSTDS